MKRHKGNRWQGVLLGTFLGVSSLFAQQGQTGYQPTPENLQARQEFSDSKFGIFLHWGIYSMFGQGNGIWKLRALIAMSMRRLLPAFIRPASMQRNGWQPLRLQEPSIFASQPVIMTDSPCLIPAIRIMTL